MDVRGVNHPREGRASELEIDDEDTLVTPNPKTMTPKPPEHL